MVVPIHGEPIRLHVSFRSYPLDYEQKALSAFLSLIAPGDVVWDVGANVGIYTLLAARKTGPAGRVVAWEPSPATFRILSSHARANGVTDRCQLLQAAVHDGSSASASFWIDKTDSMSTTNRLSSAAMSGGGQTITVEAADLDGWCKQLGQCPKVVKIDVEGAEALVLRGASKLMRGELGPRPGLLVAVHPHMMKEFGCAPEELTELVTVRGYRALSFDGQRVSPTGYTEYLLLPAQAADGGAPGVDRGQTSAND
jgi:FkbM family methyltransferase